jgi:DNA-binding MarR family transcriptional regulator
MQFLLRWYCADERTNTLKALADATRLQIIGLLAKKERSVDELAAALGLTAPTVSHHLARLQKAGLIQSRTAQYYSLFTLTPGALAHVGQQISNADRDTALTSQTDEAAFEKAVIEKFTQDASWPTGLQKQRVVLRWIGATKFALGVRYTQEQVEDILVNAILGPDTNTLRRYMITERVLDRISNGSWYWRADTPEAALPGFNPHDLPPAQHELSPRTLVLHLRPKTDYTAHEVDTLFAQLGAQNAAAARAQLLREDRLSVSNDGQLWRVANPAQVANLRIQRMQSVIAKYFRKGEPLHWPSARDEQLELLRWFSLDLNRGKTYSDAQLTKKWHGRYPDVDAMKRMLLDAGFIIQSEAGKFVRP